MYSRHETRHMPRLRLAPPRTHARFRAAVTELGFIRRIIPSTVNERKKSERKRITALRLLVCGVFAVVISTIFHTPGAWSDFHSQWFPALFRALASLPLFIATHRIYIGRGESSKLQAGALWFLFGAIFTSSLVSLVDSQRWCTLCGRPGPFDYLSHPSAFFYFPWGHF